MNAYSSFSFIFILLSNSSSKSNDYLLIFSLLKSFDLSSVIFDRDREGDSLFLLTKREGEGKKRKGKAREERRGFDDRHNDGEFILEIQSIKNSLVILSFSP